MKSKITFSLLGLALLSPGPVTYSQVLLRDVNQTTNELQVHALYQYRDQVFFSGNDGFPFSYELFRTDGTASGTGRVANLWPVAYGNIGADPAQLTGVGDFVFFTMENEDRFLSRQLAKSDGTAGGTSIVTDQTDPEPIYPRLLASLNDELYVHYADKLIKMDPVTNEPTLLLTLPPFAGIDETVGFVKWNDQLFFILVSFESGPKLWRTDGTPAGTRLVKSLNSMGGDQIEQFTAGDNTLFFWADDGISGSELWKTDGTAAGTLQVLDAVPGSGGILPYDRLFANGKLYFIRGSNGELELWESNGTAQGTRRLSGLTGLNFAGELTWFNNRLYFWGEEFEYGRELWTVDVNGNITLVKDILPGPDHSVPQDLTVFDGYLYFTAQEPEHGRELWRSDGTAAGTLLVRDIYDGATASEPASFFVLDDHLLFLATDRLHNREFWKISAGRQEPELVRDLNISTAGSEIHQFVKAGPRIYLPANDGLNGQELWKIDPLNESLDLVKDLTPGAGNGGLDELHAYQDQLVFKTSNMETLEDHLWKSDGTAAGTQVFISGLQNALRLTPCNDYLYFEAFNGTQIWLTDGTTEGTQQVLREDEPFLDHSFANFTCFQDRFYFSTINSYFFRTTADPFFLELVEHFNYFDHQNMGSLTPFGDRMLLSFDGPELGRELWISTGETGGTSLLKDIAPGAVGSSPEYFSQIGDQMFFIAFDGSSYSLWKTNGSAAGTVRIKALSTPGFGYMEFHGFAALNGIAYFMTNENNSQNVKHWRSDGTEAGTYVINTVFFNGGTSMAEKQFHVIGNELYYVSYDFDYGYELWKTDGTSGGASRITDLCPGSCSGNPQGLTVIDGRLYFTAYHPDYGREAWVYAPTPTAVGDPREEKLVDRPLFTAYPNPAAGGAVIDIRFEEDLPSESHLTLYTPDGKQLWQQHLRPAARHEKARLQTGAFPSGMYVIRLSSSRGVSTQKLLITD